MSKKNGGTLEQLSQLKQVKNEAQGNENGQIKHKSYQYG